MPDAGITDGASDFDQAFHETYIRKQVIAQLTTASLPAAATEGRLFADTTVNGLVIDNGSALVPAGLWGAWTAFTPTIAASTTSPTGWTTAGAYWQFGKLVVARASFTYGAGTAASGSLRFGLPVTASSTWCFGVATLNNSGTGYWYGAELASTTYLNAVAPGATSTVTGASPFTPGASDFYRYFVVYEAA